MEGAAAPPAREELQRSAVQALQRFVTLPVAAWLTSGFACSASCCGGRAQVE